MSIVSSKEKRQAVSLKSKYVEALELQVSTLQRQLAVAQIEGVKRMSCSDCVHAPADSMKHPCDECCCKCRCNFEAKEASNG